MIKKAELTDVQTIHGLLKLYGDKGVLLPRPLSSLYDHVRDFMVYLDQKNAEIAGCCALQVCWEDIAEIRSLAVHPDHQNKKIGARLVEAALSEAKDLNIKKVFTLTYKPDFFKKYGFFQIERTALPLKIWGDCLLCVKYPDCDETAMMKPIDS